MRWFQEGLHERLCKEWQAWFARQPVWTFTMHADGEITGDWSRPMEEWQAEEPKGWWA